MKTATAGHAPSPDLYSQIEARLWQERERIYAEIHAYPPPIPACDAQFNYLIEKRALIAKELSAIRALKMNAPEVESEDSLLRQCLAESQILHRAAKEEFLSLLDHPNSIDGE
ncbi:MAG: hypothetical protein KF753_16385 [Caldilineaceae bacterium]|nr:hypothetical protein [Caldilineaceae bacterium]